MSIKALGRNQKPEKIQVHRVSNLRSCNILTVIVSLILGGTKKRVFENELLKKLLPKKTLINKKTVKIHV